MSTNDIADAAIRHAESGSSAAPGGFRRDDMGYLVESNLDEDKARYAEYLLIRILRKHNNIYMRYGRLYCGHRMLSGTPQEVLELADSPFLHANPGQAAWIFNRLREFSPEIDENKIIIGEDIYWDADKAQICELKDLTNFKRVKR